MEATIDKLRLKPVDKDILILEDQVLEVRNSIEFVRIETLTTMGYLDKTMYKTKCKEFTYQLDDFAHQIVGLKLLLTDRKELLDGAVPQIIDIKSEKGVIQFGDTILVESGQSLGRTMVQVQQTIDIGKNVSNTLTAQTQQMQKELDDLNEIDDTMNRAKVHLTRMLRKMATDRYVCLLTILLFLAIVFIIVWKKYL